MTSEPTGPYPGCALDCCLPAVYTQGLTCIYSHKRESITAWGNVGPATGVTILPPEPATMEGW